MIRLLTDAPEAFDLAQLAGEAPPGCIDVNLVAGQVAGYWNDPDAPTQDTWDACVAAHVPTQTADPREVAATAVSRARSEVSGFSTTSGTRQAVEALADALEALAQ